jgi:phosphotriesterase-related protein
MGFILVYGIFLVILKENMRNMRKRIFSYFKIFSVFIILCSCSGGKGRIMTVNGWLDAEKMGITLTHEHIMVDFIGADSTGYHRWNRDSVIMRTLPYLEELKGYGCKTFIDCTPAYLGRDPVVLKNLARESGLNIVTTTGYYGAFNDKYIPEHIRSLTAEQIADIWLQEWIEGIDGTGIRPGIIKIAVQGDSILSEFHRTITRAAAIAHLESGLTIVSHTGPGSPAFEQLEILKREGVSPEAFIWTHAARGTKEEQVKAAEMGAWISLDNVSDNAENISYLIEMIGYLKQQGHLDRVLISHDAGWYWVGQPGGGNFRPYTAIFTHLIPAMKEKGFTDEDISQIMEKNPREAYSVKVRKI